MDVFLLFPLTVQPVISYSNEQAIKRNALVTTIPLLSPVYTVKFQFKLTSLGTSLANVFQMTTSNTDGTAVGQRLPCIWFRSENNQIQAQVGTSSTNNEYKVEQKYFNKNTIIGKWVQVLVTQRLEGKASYIYNVKINGVDIMSIPNTKPTTFANVKVFISNNFNPEAPGFVKDLSIIPTAKGM